MSWIQQFWELLCFMSLKSISVLTKREIKLGLSEAVRWEEGWEGCATGRQIKSVLIRNRNFVKAIFVFPYLGQLQTETCAQKPISSLVRKMIHLSCPSVMLGFLFFFFHLKYACKLWHPNSWVSAVNVTNNNAWNAMEADYGHSLLARIMPSSIINAF